MRFSEFEAQARRLTLLQALEHAAQYRASAALLHRYLEHVGQAVSADLLATELQWLAEQGLLELQAAPGGQVATLTTRGLDVATGTVVAPGVARPRPGD
jgi:Fe2+ or Zn2+ uptake regulation protein